MTAIAGLDRVALVAELPLARQRVTDARLANDSLKRAEMIARVEVLEALIGRRDLAALIAEYRPSFRPDPGLHLDHNNVSPHDLREASSWGALDEYSRWVEGLPDARRCGYSRCQAPLVLGVDDVLVGDWDDVYCADQRGCCVEARIEAAFARAGR